MKIQCPNCSQRYEVTSEDFGETVVCQTCGKPFEVSSPDRQEKERDTSTTGNEIRPTDIVFDCSNCGHSLAIDCRGAGREVPCVECGLPTRVPTIVAFPNADRGQISKADRPGCWISLGILLGLVLVVLIVIFFAR